jgi:lysophospholipase L1-like esterase
MLALAFSLCAAAPVRIWCLGDSITGGTGCWRVFLYRKLVADGYTSIAFVGSLPDGCGLQQDNRHDGHGSYLITDVAKGVYKDKNAGTIEDWLSIANPQIAIIHFGTNDCWGGGRPTQDVIDAFTVVLGKIRAKNPNVYVIVAKIIPNGAPGCTRCPTEVQALNAALEPWAASHTTTKSPIVLVDQYTGFNTQTDTLDGTHPNEAGHQKMASKFLKPVEKALDTFK